MPRRMQAYDRWLLGTHVYLFIVNNDVLVPSGVLTKLMQAMRDDGAAWTRRQRRCLGKQWGARTAGSVGAICRLGGHHVLCPANAA